MSTKNLGQNTEPEVILNLKREIQSGVEADQDTPAIRWACNRIIQEYLRTLPPWQASGVVRRRLELYVEGALTMFELTRTTS